MSITPVPSRTGLDISYEFHEAPEPVHESMTVLQHGLCHSRAMFEPLVGELLDRGIHVATVDEQTTRNWIGLNSYREGFVEGVQALQQETQRKIGSICGHSMGGMIVQEAMQKYPEWRMPTVLMAPVPLEGATPATIRTLRVHWREYLRTFRGLRVKNAFDENVVRTLFFDKETPYPIVKDTTGKLTDTPYFSYLQLGRRWPFRPAIEDTDQPTALLRSDTDFLFHGDEYDSTRALYGQMEEYILPGGHDFFIEYAGKTADTIAAFHKIHAA